MAGFIYRKVRKYTQYGVVKMSENLLPLSIPAAGTILALGT